MSAQLDDAQQAADMAAIRARWPRKVADPMAVIFEDRPELEHKGVRFLACFSGSPNGVHGLGNSQVEAEEDLHEQVAEHMQWLAEREAADYPYWTQR